MVNLADIVKIILHQTGNTPGSQAMGIQTLDTGIYELADAIISGFESFVGMIKTGDGLLDSCVKYVSGIQKGFTYQESGEKKFSINHRDYNTFQNFGYGVGEKQRGRIESVAAKTYDTGQLMKSYETLLSQAKQLVTALNEEMSVLGNANSDPYNFLLQSIGCASTEMKSPQSETAQGLITVLSEFPDLTRGVLEDSTQRRFADFHEGVCTFYIEQGLAYIIDNEPQAAQQQFKSAAEQPIAPPLIATLNLISDNLFEVCAMVKPVYDKIKFARSFGIGATGK